MQCISPEVYRVRLNDGGRLVAKQQLYGLLTRDEPYDLLAVEVDALRHLRRQGAPVPVVFGTDPGAQLILLEDAGPRTLLDVLAPSLADARRRHLARRVLDGLERIEAGLAGNSWARRAAPGASRQDLLRVWEPVADAAVDGLRALWNLRLHAGPSAGLERQVRQLCQRLADRPPTLGPTDYQPGNVVLDARATRVTFLELSKVGWDWTARRAVQYTTRVDSSGVSLLCADTVAGRRDAVDLDGHHLLFLLLLARLAGSRPATDALAQALPVSLSRQEEMQRLRAAFEPLTV